MSFDTRGIVLIDEIEQHLHPLWQVEIMGLLKKSFPQTQFIASTHSPLVASGADDCDVHILNGRRHKRIEPYGWRAQDVYSAMGLDTTRARPVQALIDEYRRLETKSFRSSLNAEEKGRLAHLKKELTRLEATDPDRTTAELDALANYLSKE